MRAHKRAPGFTIIELAICVTIMSLVTPALYVMVRSFETQHRKVLADADAAAGLRGFSEELRRDLFAMRLAEEPGLVLTGEGGCPRLSYTVDDRQLLQRRGEAGCEADRIVARGVERFVRRGGTVEVTFARRVAADEIHRTTLLLGVVTEGTP